MLSTAHGAFGVTEMTKNDAAQLEQAYLLLSQHLDSLADKALESLQSKIQVIQRERDGESWNAYAVDAAES